MKLLAFIATAALGTSFSIQAESLQCNFDSNYIFSRQGRTQVFYRDTAPAKLIHIQDGRLSIDGRELELSSQDQERVAEFENEMRLLIPQVKQVTTLAVDIAFTALIEVSRGLSGEHNSPTIAKLQRAKAALYESLKKNPALFINGDIDEKIIEPILTDFIPDVIAAAVKQALTVAFRGDETAVKAFDARMDKMGKDIETNVAVRAKKLEPLAQAMCSRVRNMDKIEDSISVRLSNKEKINIFDYKAP